MHDTGHVTSQYRRTKRGGLLRHASTIVKELWREFGKFLGVGAFAYVIDVGIFNLATYTWHFDAYTSKAISTVVAVTVTFCGNRFWTWRHRSTSRLHREYLLYFIFNAIGLGITLACVGIYEAAAATWPTALDNPIALNLAVNVLGVGAVSVFRFYAYRTWVFRG